LHFPSASVFSVTDESARRALRAQMRTRRLALPATVRMKAAETVATHARTIERVWSSGYVAGYWASRGELPLHALLAPPPPFVYCLPCITESTDLRFAPWRHGDALVQNRYGIPEPDVLESSQLQASAMNAVLLPLLAFDRSGTRLGAGGGYYDRSLAADRGQRPLLIGIGYGFQEVEHLPRAAWDVPLDWIITEHELIRCDDASSN
jgi:5-formyltetrahydrofolate cyclo-ligase